jgi:twinkle protein
MNITTKGLEFLTDRKISIKTLERWPVASAEVPFAGLGRKEAVLFGYFRDGQMVNWKARCISEKAFTQQPGGEQRFWNLDRVLAGPMDVVYITEGEMDALALAETGYPDNLILAFPGGAPSGTGGPAKESKRYEHVIAALASGLAKAKAFLILNDNDDPGRRLRNDLVALLGAAKCRIIDFPPGIKDVNEALIAWGAEDLRIFITDGQREWPIAGLYRLSALPTPPRLELWDPPFASWKYKIKIGPTMLSVLTGMPGNGKSLWSQFFWFEIARKYDIRVALFSAETPAKPHVRRSLREFYHGYREQYQTEAQLAAADEWIEGHFFFVAHPNARPTFGWLMEMIEAAKYRYGCRVAVVDPWNKIEGDYDPKNGTETQWIGQCLDEALDAARAFDMHIQIVAHPAKPHAEQRKEPPGLYSISGSQHWANRVDQGFSIHRPKMLTADGAERETGATLYHLKARFPDLGWPCSAGIRYNLSTGRYQEENNAESEPA